MDLANFAAVVDPDPERRALFLGRARSVVALVDGLTQGSIDFADAALVWAAARTAPVDTHREATGVAVLWGVALSASGPLDARALFAAWTRPHPERSSPASGFHAGAVIQDARFVVGCDLLGLFPIYHWSAHGATVVASSPALIHLHPAFISKRDDRGLAGVLLTGGVVAGRTLQQGLHRLAPGHLLTRAASGAVAEVLQYPLPASDPVIASLDEGAELLDPVLARAVERHVPAEGRRQLLLSGGRDSRLLAGYLDRAGRGFDTVTLGRSSDFDAVCARAVARALRVPNRVDEVALERYEGLAGLHLRAEELLGHFAGMHNWGMEAVLGGDGEGVVTGHMLGYVCGGVDYEWAGALHDGGPSEAAFWSRVADHALPLPQLRKLVRDPSLLEAVEHTDRELRAAFQRNGEPFPLRVRAHVFGHWARHHAGAVPWRLSFASWPVVPALDVDVLAASALLSPRRTVRREVQHAILRRNPRLAGLPLVRSSGSLEPISPGPAWVLAGALRRVGERLHVLPIRSPATARTHDRYRRIYDLDNEGWRAVRQRAEPFRQRLHDLFDAGQLMALLPPPHRSVGLERPILEGYGRKCLLGLMLLAGTE